MSQGVSDINHSNNINILYVKQSNVFANWVSTELVEVSERVAVSQGIPDKKNNNNINRLNVLNCRSDDANALSANKVLLCASSTAVKCEFDNINGSNSSYFGFIPLQPLNQLIDYGINRGSDMGHAPVVI